MTPQILISMPKYSDQNEIMPIIISSPLMLTHPQSKNQNGTPEHDGTATTSIQQHIFGRIIFISHDFWSQFHRKDDRQKCLSFPAGFIFQNSQIKSFCYSTGGVVPK